MKPRVLSAGWLWVIGTAISAFANEADMTISGTSIRVPGAEATDFVDTPFAIQFTSDYDENGPVSMNEDWYPFVGTVGYQTVFSLKSPDFGIAEVGFLDVDIPNSGDVNLNFLTDFFEVDRAVSGETTGTIAIGDTSNPVTAVWSRAAGQTTGSLTVSFPGFPSLLIGDLRFEHTFEIFQYRGKLAYAPTNGPIDARVDLARVGGEGRFTGPFPLKIATERTLDREPATWNGPNNESYDVLGSFDIEGVELILDRIPNRPQYAGSFFFLDGVPSTPFQDEYDLFDVFIADPNDADHDGLPDLSDPVAVTPPVAPEASLVYLNGNLQLNVKAKAGASIALETRSALTTGNWAVQQTLTLVNDTETIVLPAAAGSEAFWRVTTP